MEPKTYSISLPTLRDLVFKAIDQAFERNETHRVVFVDSDAGLEISIASEYEMDRYILLKHFE